MSKRNKIIGVLIVLVFLLLALLWGQFSKAKTTNEFNQALGDELELIRNEKGQQEASIAVLTAQKEDALLQLRSKDTVIQWLQETVKDYKGALNTAIVLNNTTETQGTTQTVIIRDTVIREGKVVRIQDFYETSWSNRWEDGYILATPDSIMRDIKVKNEYEITLGAVKNPLFKPKEYEVRVVNLNPNTSTRELRSFQVKAKPKRVSIGLQLGYGVGLIDFKPQPYVGVGVQLNLLAIK